MTTPAVRRLHLEVTNRCNSVCATCVRTSHPLSDRDLSLAEVERIVAALPDLESVALQVNGEPLIYESLPEVIELLGRRGLWVELNTNAISLNARMGARLIAARLDQLNISLDGMERATYTQLRGVDRLARVLDNARDFLAQRGPAPGAPRVGLWMTISQHNLEQLPQVIDFAAEIGADEVYVQRLVFYGEGFARDEDSLHGRLTAAQTTFLTETMARASRLGVTVRASGGYDPLQMLTRPPQSEPWRGCRRPTESAVVMANGDVVPCCISTFVGQPKDITMGNALTTEFAEIWHGPAYAEMRRSLASGSGPDFCRGCGVNWSL